MDENDRTLYEQAGTDPFSSADDEAVRSDGAPSPAGQGKRGYTVVAESGFAQMQKLDPAAKGSDPFTTGNAEAAVQEIRVKFETVRIVVEFDAAGAQRKFGEQVARAVAEIRAAVDEIVRGALSGLSRKASIRETV
jgi:hypothetical protein